MEHLSKIIIIIVFLRTSGVNSELSGPVKCVLSPLPGGCKKVDSCTAGKMFLVNVSSLEIGPNSRFVVIDANLEFEAVLYFVSSFFHSNNRAGANCSEVVGVVGNIGSKTASILHTLASRSNVTFTQVAAVAPSTFLPVANLVLPSVNVLDIQPLSNYIESIVRFIEEWNWSRVGLIRDDTLYYQYSAELLHSKLVETSKTITPNFIVKKSRCNIRHILRQVNEYGTHVFVLSMRKGTALSLLEEAQELNRAWPEYAWIVFSVENDPNIFTGHLKGTFFTRDYSEIELNKVFNNTDDSLGKFFSSNTGLVKFREGKRLHNVSVVQLVNSSESELEIAYYDPILKQLYVIRNLSASGNVIPHGSTVILEYNDSAVGIALVLMIWTIVFAFLTIIFASYIYFRDEPEIKATSFSVSLCMFVGCYLMLLFIPFLIIEVQPDGHLGFNGDILCNILVVLSGIGVPPVLIFASLFIKSLCNFH